MKIKVTIILPSYNVTNYIEQCVSSVLTQTLNEIEILCIDAGSTDGTLEKLEKIATDNSKIRLIHSGKKSYGYQMNLGIREARGEYIGIVETDDYVDSDMFETLHRRAKETEADVVKGVLYDVYETGDGYIKEFYADYISDRYFSDIIISPDETPDVHEWDGNIWNGIYKRDFLIEKGIWFQETPGASFQDIGFQQLVLNEANKVAYMHAHFYHYRKVRPGASTWNPKCVRYICDAYRVLLANERLKEKHRKYIYMRLSNAFLFELKKALSMSNHLIESIEYPEGVDWYITEMKNAMNSGCFKLDDLNENNREEVALFFSDLDAYIDKWKQQSETLYGWLDEIREKSSNSKLYVFGAGRYGSMVLRFLIRNGFWVEGMVDNLKGKNNIRYYDTKVYSADDAVRRGNGFFLVANKRAGESISLQLQSLGVAKEKILIFDGTNEMLLKGMEKTPILPARMKK